MQNKTYFSFVKIQDSKEKKKRTKSSSRYINQHGGQTHTQTHAHTEFVES